MFEETLKGMIQEARQMVKREETESGDEVRKWQLQKLRLKLTLILFDCRCRDKAIWSCR